MPHRLSPDQHVKPFVHESLTSKAMHFSICAIQSRMKLQDPYALDLPYTRTMMGFLLLLPKPRLVTMIGLGGGSLAKFCHRYLPATRVEVVEINPHVIALRDTFHVPPDGQRMQVIHDDGARFVRESTSRPDVLMLDGFDTDGQPTRLCTQRFYDDCHDLLASDGVLVVNLHFASRRHAACLARIERSFPGAVRVVDDGELSNTVVFACKGRALDACSGPTVRRPRGLHRSAAAELRGAFALVGRALPGPKAE